MVNGNGSGGRQEFTAQDYAARAARKDWDAKRPKGSIPKLTDEILDDPEWLRDWLTVALRPRQGWRVLDFSHGDDEDVSCKLELSNGQDRAKYHWRTLRDLSASPERLDRSISAKASGQLRPPQLTKPEHGDLIRALCTLRPAVVGQSVPDKAKDWLFKVLDAARPLEGHTLTDTPGQKDALAALRRINEFSPLDADAVRRRPEDSWPRQPICLIDRVTGALGLRPLEALTILRHIHQIKMRQAVLTFHWNEIGIEYRHFDVGRHANGVHLHRSLYLVPPGARHAE